MRKTFSCGDTKLTLSCVNGVFYIRGKLCGMPVNKEINNEKEVWYIWHDYIDYAKG